MKRRRHGLGAAALVLMALIAGSAQAGAITVGGGWVGFCFGDVGSAASAGCQNGAGSTTGNPFTFSTPGPVEIQLTDAFQKGDQFKLVIGGNEYFTSVVAIDPAGSVIDPDAAWADATYSKLSLLLGAGDYSFDIFSAVSPYGGGGAYVQVVRSAVPTPATLALLGMALVGMALLRGRKFAA